MRHPRTDIFLGNDRNSAPANHPIRAIGIDRGSARQRPATTMAFLSQPSMEAVVFERPRSPAAFVPRPGHVFPSAITNRYRLASGLWGRGGGAAGGVGGAGCASAPAHLPRRGLHGWLVTGRPPGYWLSTRETADHP